MRVIFLLLLAFLSSNAFGITLEQAVNLALKKNDILSIKNYELKQKKEDFLISKLKLLPTVNLYSNYNKSSEPPYVIMNRMERHEFNIMGTDFNRPGISDLFKTGVKGFLPIWLGGKIRIGIDLNRNEVKVGRAQLANQKLKTVFNVVKAYLSVLTAKSFIKTANLAVMDADKHLKDAKVVYSSGLGLKSDYLRAKVFKEQMDENLVEAESNLKITKKALCIAIGIDPMQDIDVDGKLIYKPFSFKLNDLVGTAIRERPELGEVDARLKQANDMKRLAVSDFLPSIGAFGEYFRASDENPFRRENTSWNVGIQVNIPMFNGGIRFAKLRKAKLVRLKTSRYKALTIKDIEFDVSRSYYRFLEAKKRFSLAKAALKSARESMRIIEKRYKNGISNITELLDTQTALNQARSNYVMALSSYMVSIANIYRAEGILDKQYCSFQHIN